MMEKSLEDFDIEKAKTLECLWPGQFITTKGGDPVRVICWNKEGHSGQAIIALERGVPEAFILADTKGRVGDGINDLKICATSDNPGWHLNKVRKSVLGSLLERINNNYLDFDRFCEKAFEGLREELKGDIKKDFEETLIEDLIISSPKDIDIEDLSEKLIKLILNRL